MCFRGKERQSLHELRGKWLIETQWGHSFRPDYLKVARFVKRVEAERVMCITATATTAVSEGIREAFDIKPENVFQLSPYRPKYVYQVADVPDEHG